MFHPLHIGTEPKETICPLRELRKNPKKLYPPQASNESKQKIHLQHAWC